MQKKQTRQIYLTLRIQLIIDTPGKTTSLIIIPVRLNDTPGNGFSKGEHSQTGKTLLPLIIQLEKWGGDFRPVMRQILGLNDKQQPIK